jgi:hypothetical protein
MSDSRIPAPRPVGLVTILAIFAGFALFLLILDLTYLRHPATDPYSWTPEKLGKDLAWKATPESRRYSLDQLKEKQIKQLSAYGWADQKAGAVRLPIDRAEDLVIAQYTGSSSSK